MDLSRLSRYGDWDIIGAQNRRLWTLLLCIAVIAMMSYSWLFRSGTIPNERSRVYLAVSIVDHQTVALDKPVERFGRSLDMAEYEGSQRCDKAPGGSLLGALVYGAARTVSSPDDWSFGELIDLMRYFVMIPIGLIGFLVLRRWLRGLGFEAVTVDVTSLGWILGTSAFHYSHAFFGHQIAAVGLLGAAASAWFARRASERDQDKLSWALAAAGGASAGLAGMTEYPAGIPCVAIALYVLLVFARRDWRSIVAFALGALPFLIGLLIYHDLAFGSPLDLPYYHLVNERFSDVHTSGWFGLEPPSWERFSGAMFSLHRGLFGTSPLFLLAIPGIAVLWRRYGPPLALLIGGIFLFYAVFISCWPLWAGGWAFGPRHLIACMGLLAVPVACGFSWIHDYALGDGVGRGLVGVSIFYHQTVSAFYPELPPGIANPLMEAVKLMLEQDMAGPNFVRAHTGYEGLVTLVPLAVLVAGAIGTVLIRGWFDRGGWGRRLWSFAGVLCIVLLAGGVVYAKGETWGGGDGFYDLVEMSHGNEAKVAPPGDDWFVP